MFREDCPCTRNCERHGNCDACRKNHAENHPEIPVACEREQRD